MITYKYILSHTVTQWHHFYISYSCILLLIVNVYVSFSFKWSALHIYFSRLVAMLHHTYSRSHSYSSNEYLTVVSRFRLCNIFNLTQMQKEDVVSYRIIWTHTRNPTLGVWYFAYHSDKWWVLITCHLPACSKFCYLLHTGNR
jgi:hypothetical protein